MMYSDAQFLYALTPGTVVFFDDPDIPELSGIVSSTNEEARTVEVRVGNDYFDVPFDSIYEVVK